MSVNGDKKHCWFTHRKLVDKYMKDARTLIATEDHNHVASAVHLLDAALKLSPRLETALELKARSLLFLRRFKDVANMLQGYIPSLKDDNSSDGFSFSSCQLSRDRVKLLSDTQPGRDSSLKCFSVSDLKKKVMAGLCRNVDNEGQWRYIVLGQACCHLGLMEDAIVLLQTGKRLASAESRRRSIFRSDDSFSLLSEHSSSPPRHKMIEAERISHLISHIKLFLRRRAAALAAQDAGLYSESIRHFSKILDGRRPAPQGFLADCYMHRAAAYRAAGRIAEAVSDCNKTLALEPSCIQALEARASLLEAIRCFPDSLHDLEHLRLLYNTILRDRKLPGPPWKRHNVKYREIPGKLCVLTTQIQKMKQKIANGETGNVDYYGLIGVRRGCTRSELDRAYLLLSLRHKPDKATSFIERCEFSDQDAVDSIRDQAKISSLLLYRLIHKGYSTVITNITEEEAADKQRKKAAAALAATQAAIQAQTPKQDAEELKPVEIPALVKSKTANSNVYQGVFCRDLAAVGNLLSHSGFNHSIPLKYEALSC